jgi:hypothetical protein
MPRVDFKTVGCKAVDLMKLLPLTQYDPSAHINHVSVLTMGVEDGSVSYTIDKQKCTVEIVPDSKYLDKELSHTATFSIRNNN